MDSIEYKVVRIDGDYAVLEHNGITNRVARALLPPETDEGDTLLYEDFEYTLL